MAINCKKRSEYTHADETVCGRSTLLVSKVVLNRVTTNVWKFKGISSNPLIAEVEELGVSF
jgi:hypothetical protein